MVQKLNVVIVSAILFDKYRFLLPELCENFATAIFERSIATVRLRKKEYSFREVRRFNPNNAYLLVCFLVHRQLSVLVLHSRLLHQSLDLFFIIYNLHRLIVCTGIGIGFVESLFLQRSERF